MRSQSTDGPRKLPRLEPQDVLTSTFPHLKRSAAVKHWRTHLHRRQSPRAKKTFRPTATAAALTTRRARCRKILRQGRFKTPYKICLFSRRAAARGGSRAAMYGPLPRRPRSLVCSRARSPPPKKLTPLPGTQKSVRDRETRTSAHNLRKVNLIQSEAAAKSTTKFIV